MKKKIIVALVALVLFGATSAFAKTGIGAQFGYTAGFGGLGAAVTFKIDPVPVVFAVDANFSSNHFYIGGTGDWWIQNPTISGPFGWFYGIGLAAGVYSVSSLDLFSVGIGPRAVIGLNVKLLKDFLEIYLQGAWQPTLWIGNPTYFNLVTFPINLGFRFWF